MKLIPIVVGALGKELKSLEEMEISGRMETITCTSDIGQNTQKSLGDLR